ncbi:hypothetical protein DDZ13_13360 [Coraliomargarita sinensis]|uniref:PA14 domain-containing protein n=1 Tax=Coraliomargarita sinensis TaxID=2174842 RepID=A0A317ZDD3_9BACT|nr:hypothetical protein [Coraliomargarita sinensis]PXA03206.1 hypothetical protein DDZ13_13360 [Coraliomargarita sinensis]
MKQFFGKKSRSTLALVIMVSFALHIVAVVIFGTIKFVSAVLREETVFEAAPVAPPPQKEPEYTVNIQQRNESTPPPRPPAIVVNNPSELDIPALNIDVNVDSSSVFGRGGGGFGGSGITGMREMAMEFKLTDFGYTGKTEGTLEATLIDLKRDRSGDPINISRKGTIREFTDGSWNLGSLTRKFYTAENKLYGSYWMIPNGSADKAPKSFGVEGEIEPSGIVAFYEGTYTPPKDMQIRLCGMADDVLIVRLNSRIILDASWEPGYSDEGLDDSGPNLPGVPKNIRYGDWINLRAGETYDLKILLSEIPGGAFCCFLFYQEKDDEKLRVFSTKELTGKEKRILRDMGPAVADAL